MLTEKEKEVFKKLEKIEKFLSQLFETGYAKIYMKDYFTHDIIDAEIISFNVWGHKGKCSDVPFNKYGASWALTKEELENEND